MRDLLAARTLSDLVADQQIGDPERVSTRRRSRQDRAR
jgi:hypothetical protein